MLPPTLRRTPAQRPCFQASLGGAGLQAACPRAWALAASPRRRCGGARHAPSGHAARGPEPGVGKFAHAQRTL